MKKSKIWSMRWLLVRNRFRTWRCCWPKPRLWWNGMWEWDWGVMYRRMRLQRGLKQMNPMSLSLVLWSLKGSWRKQEKECVYWRGSWNCLLLELLNWNQNWNHPLLVWLNWNQNWNHLHLELLNWNQDYNHHHHNFVTFNPNWHSLNNTLSSYFLSFIPRKNSWSLSSLSRIEVNNC